MSIRCQPARAWLAAQGTGGSALTAEDHARCAAHVAGCPACSTLLYRYQEFARQAAADLEHTSEAEAEVRFLEGLAVGPSPESAEAVGEALSHAPAPGADAAFVVAARAAGEQRETASDRTRARWRRAGGIAGATALAATIAAVVLWPGDRSDQTDRAEAPPLAEAASSPGAGAAPAPHPPPQQNSMGPFVSIGDVSGSVTSGGTSLTSAASSLPLGTDIKTSRDGRLTFGEPPNAAVTVGAETRLVIETWGVRHTRLVLSAGTVRARVAHRPERERFEVLTPTARVVVVGTEFTVAVAPDGRTRVSGRSGRVRVERPDGSVAGFVTAGTRLNVGMADDVAAPVATAVRDATPAPHGTGTAPAAAASSGGPATRRRPAATETARLVTTLEPERPRLSVVPRVVNLAAPTARRRPGPVSGPKRGRATALRRAATRGNPLRRRGLATMAALDPLAQARTWISSGSERKAIALLSRTPPGDWRRDALLGDAYRLAGHPTAAARAYADAIARADRPPAPVQADLATMLDRLDKPTEALAIWRRYVALHPRGADIGRAHLTLAKSAFTDNRGEDAERHLRAILDMSPVPGEGTTALILLGRRLLAEQRWKDAETVFAPRAVQNTGARAEAALVGLIRVRIGQGRRQDAETLLGEYERRFPAGARSAEVERLRRALDR